ncbi:zinc dependent phospholipase C family protein [Mucilaginibacter sp. AW1-3]
MNPVYFKRCLFLLLTIGMFIPLSSKGYAVLAHEALIDASWEKHLLPLLKKNYPNSTDDELKVAHSYAYGGALIADMGYYPFGSTYYTDLAHYVRSGDFVMALINQSETLNEYAFALGALSHYMADKYGHSLATNVVVPMVYPKIKQKFGDVVTYEEDRTSHSRLEFAFDVLQTARGNYASSAYHNFIGFNVARPVLERAFLRTYGEDINSVFGDLALAISTFRWTVKNIFPGLAKTAWQLKKDEIKKINPTATARSFKYRMSRKNYYEEFGKDYEKPNFGSRVMAFVIKILPKVGPLKSLKFIPPGAEGEKRFAQSFDSILVHYNIALAKLDNNQLTLPDIDFDTGKPTKLGEYGLTDDTYNDLVLKLKDKKFDNLSKPLKQNILLFYNTPDTVAYAKKKPDEWKKTYAALQELKVAPTIKMDTLKTFPPDKPEKAKGQ